MAQRLKRLPAMRETWVRSLGREDPLEKEMAESVFLVSKFHWTSKGQGCLSCRPKMKKKAPLVANISAVRFTDPVFFFFFSGTEALPSTWEEQRAAHENLFFTKHLHQVFTSFAKKGEKLDMSLVS